MKKNIKTIVVPALIAALAGLAVTGCGEVRPADGVQQPVSETPAAVTAVTEAVIIIQTEAPETEPETEPETVPVTEPPQTEPQTQPQTTPPTEPQLSEEEELAAEFEYDDWLTMYANADINVRETPSTANDENIESSYDRGEEVLIIGETVNWYLIYKEYDPVSEQSELRGYVMKEYISGTYEEAMTERPQETAPVQTPETSAPQEVEPQSAEPAQTAPEASAPAQTSSASGPSVTVKSDSNIRSEAYETASVVGVVPAGASVTQIGSADGWVQIDYNGVQGYVKSSFIG